MTIVALAKSLQVGAGAAWVCADANAGAISANMSMSLAAAFIPQA